MWQLEGCKNGVRVWETRSNGIRKSDRRGINEKVYDETVIRAGIELYMREPENKKHLVIVGGTKTHERKSRGSTRGDMGSKAKTEIQ